MHPPARLLDLTDLFNGIGAGPLTGINRVCKAYLDYFLTLDNQIFGMVNHHWGIFLLDRRGMVAFAKGIEGDCSWGPVDWLAALQLGISLEQRRALSFLRRNAIGRARTPGLGRMLRRLLPAGTAYISTGLNNLRQPVFTALRQVAAMRIAVLVHDTIPLDFPQYVPVGGEKWFAERLAIVGKMADLIIYNSAHSQASAKRHLARWGRVPPGLVAHLGVTALKPDFAAVPPNVDPDRPFFVVLGTIEPRKNHMLLLDIWESLSRDMSNGPCPALLIIGTRGWRNEAVFHRLDTSPMMGRDVFELNGLGDGAVAALVQSARGLLFPSHSEGFGLPAIEAALLGTPVLCNALAVYHEFMGDYPIYAPVSDRSLWERSIRSLAQTPRNQHKQLAHPPEWAAHFDLVFSKI